jgi:5'-deoxynucleotidase YfbR-like HD superfamily hydrolase
MSMECPNMSDQCLFIGATTFDDIFNHSHCKRYHTEHTRRTQNLAEHCFRVTLIAVKILYAYKYFLLHNAVFPTDIIVDWKGLELELYRYALMHEASELDSGDVPSHIKWSLRENYNIDLNKIVEEKHWTARGITEERQVHPVVKMVVSFADTLEGIVFCEQIPEGRVKESVLNDWYLIWGKKLKIFEDTINNKHFLNYLNELLAEKLYVDPAWV